MGGDHEVIAFNPPVADLDGQRFLFDFADFGFLMDRTPVAVESRGPVRRDTQRMKLRLIGKPHARPANFRDFGEECRVKSEFAGELAVGLELFRFTFPLRIAAEERRMEKTGNSPEVAVDLFRLRERLDRVDRSHAGLQDGRVASLPNEFNQRREASIGDVSQMGRRAARVTLPRRSLSSRQTFLPAFLSR